MADIIIRHDDFDFRLPTQDYIDIHEQFIRKQIYETAVLQFGQFDHIANVRDDLVQYMTSTPYWDIQIHGFQHEEYDKFTFYQIVRDLAACKYFALYYFGQVPSIWFPPWNRDSEDMRMAAAYMKMTVNNESHDIRKFVREQREGMFIGHSLYFHGWNKIERDCVPEMLELVEKMRGGT